MAAKKETGYPRTGRMFGSLGEATITGLCEWEPDDDVAPHPRAGRTLSQRPGAPRYPVLAHGAP